MAVNVVVGLAVSAGGVLAFCGWLPIARWRQRRHQQPGPAAAPTMELRGEPPAVVGLLVDELRLSSDAFAATLLDLAARRHIEIFQVSPDHHVIRRRRHGRPDRLRDFEAQVLAIVDASLGPNGDVTVQAITGAVGGGSGLPWFEFAAAVRVEAENLGLTAAAKPYGTGTLMVLAVIVCGGLALAAPEAWILTPFLYVGLVLAGLYLAARRRTSVLTDEGRVAAQHWLGVRRFIDDHGSFDDLPPAAVAIWDRYLSHAAAMGLSDAAVDSLVDEVRTSLSISDVVTVGTQVARTIRALRDPAKVEAWRLERLRARFGPETDPGDLFGPEGGDFWALLVRTAQTWGIAAVALEADRGAWLAAAHRRIDALAAAAPPELATDVRALSAPAHVCVTLMAAAGRSGEITEDPFADPHVRAAYEHVLPAVARHLGVQPTSAAVEAALLRMSSARPEASAQ